jgi:hypothetical protein
MIVSIKFHLVDRQLTRSMAERVVKKAGPAWSECGLSVVSHWSDSDRSFYRRREIHEVTSAGYGQASARSGTTGRRAPPSVAPPA